jgi:hypothetical protein
MESPGLGQQLQIFLGCAKPWLQQWLKNLFDSHLVMGGEIPRHAVLTI